MTDGMSNMCAGDMTVISSDARIRARLCVGQSVSRLPRRGSAMKSLDPWTRYLGPRPCLVVPCGGASESCELRRSFGTEDRHNDEIQVDPWPLMFRMRAYRKTKQNLARAPSFNGVGVAAAVTGFVIPVWAMIAMTSSVNPALANSFGGQLLRGEPPNARCASVTRDDHHQERRPSESCQRRSTFATNGADLLAVSIGGHTVRLWATLSVAITAATILVGVWWT
jgi:hypothetical protein